MDSSTTAQFVRFVRAGDKAQAMRLIAGVLRQNPQDVQAWLAMAQITEGGQQRDCLKRVLAISPDNAYARRRLQGPTAPPAPAVVPFAPEAVPPAPPTPAPSIVPQASPSPRPAAPSTPVPAAPPPAAPPLTFPGLAPAPAVPPAGPPAPPPRAAQPWSSAEKLLVALLGFVLAVAVCGGGLALLVMSHQLDRATAQVAAAIWSPTPTVPGATPASSHTPAISLTPLSAAQPSFNSTQGAQTAPTAGLSRTPTPTPKPTRTRSPTPTPNSVEQAAEVARLFIQAQNMMNDKKFAEAVTVLDQAVTLAPDNAEAYFQRARAYSGLLLNNRFHDEYIDYVHRALADVNQAIALDPAVGDYYYFRYMFDEDLAVDEPYRVDYTSLETIALENARIANQLGNTQPDSERVPALILPNLGRCDEGLAEAQQLDDARGPSAPPSAGLHTALALAYVCKGQLDAALEHINVAIQAHNNSDRTLEKIIILYNMGRLDEALAMLNDDINHYPYY